MGKPNNWEVEAALLGLYVRSTSTPSSSSSSFLFFRLKSVRLSLVMASCHPNTYVNVWLYATCVLVHTKARRGRWMHWSCSDRWLWISQYEKLNSSPLEEQEILVTCEATSSASSTTTTNTGFYCHCWVANFFYLEHMREDTWKKQKLSPFVAVSDTAVIALEPFWSLCHLLLPAFHFVAGHLQTTWLYLVYAFWL